MASHMSTDSIARLRKTGEKLPSKLREEILELGAVAVPGLIALLIDEDASKLSSPGGGWPPIHAVDLLVDLNATDSIEPMLAVLVSSDWMEIIHDRIIQRMPELGAPVLEPALALLERTEDEDARQSVCDVLSRLGVKHERIYLALCEQFETSPTFGSMLFYEYGDSRALPLLLDAIEAFEPDFSTIFHASNLADLVDCYQHLGGVMPDEISARNEAWFARWEATRREALGRSGASSERRRERRVGRNEPCPCGSGKKYKKCCIDARERSPAPAAEMHVPGTAGEPPRAHDTNDT
jgi:hypothetical protein